MLFPEVYVRNARHFSSKVAFEDEYEKVTFAEFNHRVNALIEALDGLGVRRGKVVGILGNNSVRYLEVCGTGEKGGRVIVPLNVRFTPEDLIYVINDCEIDVLFVDAPYMQIVEAIRPKLPSVKHFILMRGQVGGSSWLAYDLLIRQASGREPEIQVHGNDLLYIFYTSGTTGRPKGVMLTHFGQIQNIKNQTLELGIRPDDVMLCFMPFYHTGGKTYSMMHYCRGCTNIIMGKFDAHAALELIEEKRVTTFLCVPTMLYMFLDALENQAHDVQSLRTLVYSASPMPLSLLKRALARFGPIFIQPYGLTESGPTATYLNKEEHVDSDSPRLKSCGIPGLGVEVQVVNERGSPLDHGSVGELLLRTDTAMVGYFKRATATEKVLRNGWLYTGDMAYLDEDHYIYIAGRRDDMIISGGENVYPKEIEDVLMTHPAVEEAVVVGIPDAKWVEAVAALVKLKDGAQVAEQELAEFCRSRLARYKAPKLIAVVDELPKNATGKVIRSQAREVLLRNISGD